MNDDSPTAKPTHAPAVEDVLDLNRLRSVDDKIIVVWSKYEDVAIHFNDLIMRWRIQAIGGLLTLLTLAGFVVGDAETLTTRYRAMLILAGTLSTAWVGVALIDLFYYRKLLSGAVDAIEEVETATRDIRLSRLIERRARTGGKWAPFVFYACGWLPLLGTVWWAFYQLCVLPQE